MTDESVFKLRKQVEALQCRVELAILGYAELLAAPAVSPAERDSRSELIQRSSENLLALISDIRDFSRIEAGEIAVDKSDCCPYRVLNEVASEVHPRAEEKGLRFEIKHVPPLPKTIYTDPARLRQILATLIADAVDCTQQGDICVTVRCVTDDDRLRVQFEISDTGISVTPEEKAGLFEPCYRSDATSSRRFGGMGLRLYIARRLAEMLGGGIDVENRPGQGCLFTLVIDPGPLEGIGMLRSPPVFSQRQLAPSGNRRMLHGTILLVEDDRNLQELIQLLLAKAGFTVDLADNGRIAYEKASACAAEGNSYDLILMDIQMPELDGYETTRRLRRDGWSGPILALTAYTLPTDRQKCLDAGCSGYISKPVDWTTLLNIIAEHLGQEVSSVETPVPEQSPTETESGPLGKGLIDNETMTDLLNAFVAELPGRIAKIANALRDEDQPCLAHFSHQLKGAAAVYGFDQIALAAESIHKLVGRNSDHRQLQIAVDKLIDLCKTGAGERP